MLATVAWGFIVVSTPQIVKVANNQIANYKGELYFKSMFHCDHYGVRVFDFVTTAKE